jgi:hypothetical protein
MLSAALLTRYSQQSLLATVPICPITLERKTKRPPRPWLAAATSGATCGMTCIAPSTLACMTRSNSGWVGGSVALPRLMTPATYSAMSMASPSSCQARPLTLAGWATSTFRPWAPAPAPGPGPGHPERWR